MKRFLLWTFERGSRPYDVICAVILAFIFLVPQHVFDDRPDYMRLEEGEPVRRTMDDQGNVVYTVQIKVSDASPEGTAEQAAVTQLRAAVPLKFKIAHTKPVYDTKGMLIAYAIWIDSGVLPF